VQHRGEEEVVVARRESDLDFRTPAESAFELQRRIYSTETATQDEHPADVCGVGVCSRRTGAFGGLVFELVQLILLPALVAAGRPDHLDKGRSPSIFLFASPNVTGVAVGNILHRRGKNSRGALRSKWQLTSERPKEISARLPKVR
jgi:hypothetical protein